MSWNKDELLETLTFPGGFLPQDGLDTALEHYDEIKADLYAAIQRSPEDVKAIEAIHNKEYSLKFFAMYLVAEKQDADAFEYIHQYFSIHGGNAWTCIGKMKTADLTQVLAALWHGDIKAKKDTFSLDGMDPYAYIAFVDACSL